MAIVRAIRRVFMKFASLVFLLVPFVANAADLCVEDNISKCKELGYTESSCPYGGVACQYDTSLWYCAKWTCADGRLYSAENKPTDAYCVETAYKNMTCYDCKVASVPYDKTKTIVATFSGGGSTTVINSIGEMSRMWVDGVEVTPKETIELASGTHEVAMEFLNNNAIPNNAFRGCTYLTKITIPESVTTIGSNAFYGCSSLETITYLGTTSMDNCSFSRGFLATIYVPTNYEGETFCRISIIRK